MANLEKLKTKNNPSSVIDTLNLSLANMLDMKLAAKQAHWNVKGENFIALHQLFDALAGEIDGYSDLLAERALQLGGIAQGTLQLVAKNSSLSAYPTKIVKSSDHIKALSENLSILAEHCRQAIETSASAGDAVTSDLFTEITRGLDKSRWFIESHK